MTVIAAAGYGITICVATSVLIPLSSMTRPLVIARSSGRRMPEGEQLRPNRPFDRKDIR